MQVLLVSNCSGNAAKRSRRVLNRYAERVSDRSWTTRISSEGLVSLRADLRKYASRSTSIACHQFRKDGRRELLFIIGDASRFGPDGLGIDSTRSVNSIQQAISNRTPHVYEGVVKALARLAGVTHDLGKASLWFQQKLRLSLEKVPSPIADPYRHELISAAIVLRLCEQMAEQPACLDLSESLSPLAADSLRQAPLLSSANRLGLPSLLWIWVVLSHHRLPQFANPACLLQKEASYSLLNEVHTALSDDGYRNEWAEGNEIDNRTLDSRLCSEPRLLEALKSAYASYTSAWEKVPAPNADATRWIATQARMALILGDHLVSSQPALWGHSEAASDATGLFANTEVCGDRRHLKQGLAEHLVRVAKSASQAARAIPVLAETLPTVPGEGLVKSAWMDARSPFFWQQDLVAKIRTAREADDALSRTGALCLVVAGTGTGKTLGNPAILGALRPQLRLSVGLGLRSLTDQTGREYKRNLQIDDADCAVMIGSTDATRIRARLDAIEREKNGTSTEPMQPPGEFFGGTLKLPQDASLYSFLPATGKMASYMAAPVLVCTIDHLMPAVDDARSGYITAALRVMSSDLIIDEIDDFDEVDVAAICRLVYLAASAGRNVLASSATLPPPIADALIQAYASGWNSHTAGRNNDRSFYFVLASDRSEHSRLERVPDSVTASALWRSFSEKVASDVRGRPSKVKARVGSASEGAEQWIADRCEEIRELHMSHRFAVPKTSRKFSAGLIRVPLVSHAAWLSKKLSEVEIPGIDVRLVCYHSGHPLWVRSRIEEFLDRSMKRKTAALTTHAREIHSLLTQKDERDLCLIVVATPVEEVGRDHDFDWCICDLSSVRSLIQIAGRLMRHRSKIAEIVNLVVPGTSLRELQGKPRFERPGPEGKTTLVPEGRYVGNVAIDSLLTGADFCVSNADRLWPSSSDLELAHFEKARLEQALHGLCPGRMSITSAITNSGSGVFWSDALPKLLRFRGPNAENPIYSLSEDGSFCQLDPKSEGMNWLECPSSIFERTRAIDASKFLVNGIPDWKLMGPERRKMDTSFSRPGTQHHYHPALGIYGPLHFQSKTKPID